jgi:hypothetical protein
MFVGVVALAGLALAACAPPKPAPEPTTPDCVPICPPSDGGGGQPMLNAQVRQRCLRIPIPCVPGVAIPDCVNFCPPGQDSPPPAAACPVTGVDDRARSSGR